MNKQDRAMIALNNKLQLKMMLAAMKNASRKQDKRTLIDAYENKLEEIEAEITSSNELLEQLPKDRIAKRKVLTSLTDRLDKVSEYNYIEENGQYFKLKRQTPRSILFADEDIKSAGGLDQPLFKEPRGGVPTEFKTVQVELDNLRIPIEKEVYDAAMFENAEIKKLIAKEQQSYRDIVKKETELIDKYVTNKKSVDLRFKADLLKEQLANDDIYLDLYIKDKDNYDGLVYSENLKAYTPIKYDRYLESQQLSDQLGKGEYGAFRFDVSSQRKKIDDLTKELQKDKFTIKPSASFTDANTPEDFAAIRSDFTSGYIQLPLTKDKELVQGNLGSRNVVKTVDPGRANPFYRSIPTMNTQQDMQSQIRPMLQRKNQNMNPVGFNMKSLLDK